MTASGLRESHSRCEILALSTCRSAWALRTKQSLRHYEREAALVGLDRVPNCSLRE